MAFFVQTDSKIFFKFINLKALPKDFNLISGALDKTRGDFFYLNSPKHKQLQKPRLVLFYSKKHFVSLREIKNHVALNHCF
jgi:hypothetical protein|tara:strand:- start:162844 stop:163086 length:243 start_codon:yes stop_codon:yes gene_type:complete